MHTTRNAILATLKRTDGATVDDLASSLRLAPMTVRQHLAAMERDALVHAEEARRPAGRPHYLFRLTPDGHRSVAQGLDRLLTLLVDALGTLDAAELNGASPLERRAHLFRRAAAALAEQHRCEVAALDARERPPRVVAILHAYGGFADWSTPEDGAFEIRDFSCVFRDTVRQSGRCEWHETFLIQLLGADVRIAGETTGDCAACCRYIITSRTPARAPVPNRGGLP